MAVWEVRVVMGNGSRHWENVWHVDAGSDDDVDPTVIDSLATMYETILLPAFTFEKIVRRIVGTSDEFIEAIYEVAGGRSGASGFPLPLFDVIRVLLNSGIGRPGVKYLRGCLTTGDVADVGDDIGSSFLGGVTTLIDNVISAAIAAGQQIVEGSDRAVLSATPQPKVAMRQEHRKRRRSGP